ncbi:hypothetical protein SPHINGO8AM_50093 [Sphingomonas sp. 8AM]|nr:hypothetical protein SPHINGO8AM_50093 [Sphingomonas sp. 8AM]
MRLPQPRSHVIVLHDVHGPAWRPGTFVLGAARLFLQNVRDGV